MRKYILFATFLILWQGVSFCRVEQKAADIGNRVDARRLCGYDSCHELAGGMECVGVVAGDDGTVGAMA